MGLQLHRLLFVFPAGVPHLMRQKWRAVKELLLQGRPLMPFHNQVGTFAHMHGIKRIASL